MRELQAGDGFGLSSEAKAGTIDGNRSKPFTRMTKQFRALLEEATAEYIHLSEEKPIEDSLSVGYLRDIGISGVHFAPGVVTAAPPVDRGQRTYAATWTHAVSRALTALTYAAAAASAATLRYLGYEYVGTRGSDSRGLLRGCLTCCLPPFT